MTETESIGEKLSALVDGELTGVEYGSVVDTIHSSSELKQRWMRYHIAADALKKGLPPTLLKPDFASRVMQAVDAEPTVLAPRNLSPKVNPVTKQLAGLAIAASVTAIAVLGVQTWRLQSGTEPAAEVAQVTAPVVNIMRPVATVAADNTPLPPHVQSQINQYLLSHNQNALAAQRMLPYARIVGYANGDVAE